MNLTPTEKKRLRKIFRQAQDNLIVDFYRDNGDSKSEFCCHAIDEAEGNVFGTGEDKKILSYQYFKYLFKPRSVVSVWFRNDGTQTNEDIQIRRLMALQLCELSLT